MIEGEKVEFPDYPAIAKAYAEAVASGAKPTNRLMVAAANRYLRMLEMAEDPDNHFVFSVEHVCDYCSFVEKMKHIESGRWEVTQRDAQGNLNPHIILDPSQIWEECAIHGFRLRSTDERLVTKALSVKPRKNAKSLQMAPAALFDLCCSGQIGAQIPIAASSAAHADKTLFGAVSKMVNNDDELREQFGIKITKDEISVGDSRIWKLTGIGERQDGLNPSLALFEEGHAGAASVWSVVDSAFGARPNALRRMITTAGYRPEGPGWELQKEAEQILLGDTEDYTFFAAIYTLDREDYIDPDSNAIDWEKLFTNEALVAKTNPLYGISLDPDRIKESMRTAFRRPDQRGEIARTRFNIWTSQGYSLIPLESWMACKRKIGIEDFFGQKAWLGVDLAQVLDMCAIASIFEIGDMLAIFAKFFLPEASPTALDPEMAGTFQSWHDAGWLTLTPGPLADHDLVREEVEALCSVFDVQVIACDPAQAHNTVKHLWDGERPVMTYPNSARTMTAPMDDILGKVAAQKIIHDGNPVLAWNASNVHGERKGNGLILPRKDKPNSGRKIDGFVAACFANGCRLNPQEAKAVGEDEEQVSSAYAGNRVIGLD